MFDSAELDHRLSRQAYRREEPKLREALLAAQLELKDKPRLPVLILIASVEGAGKSETINTLGEWMDRRFIRVNGFRMPTEEDRASAAAALLARAAAERADRRVLRRLRGGGGRDPAPRAHAAGPVPAGRPRAQRGEPTGQRGKPLGVSEKRMLCVRRSPPGGALALSAISFRADSRGTGMPKRRSVRQRQPGPRRAWLLGLARGSTVRRDPRHRGGACAAAGAAREARGRADAGRSRSGRGRGADAGVRPQVAGRHNDAGEPPTGRPCAAGEADA